MLIRYVACSLLLAISSGCQTKRVLYEDADLAQVSFGDLIQRTPYIVVAVVDGEKVKSGAPGLVARSSLPPFPAQRYRFALTIQRTLRGELGAGQTISVFGYETEDKVFVGPPKGICGLPGQRAVYFLKKVGDSFRVMEDSYKTFVDLDARTDLSSASKEQDVPLAIWRLMVIPLQTGVRPTRHTQLSNIAEVTRDVLGRARFIELLSAVMMDSSSQTFQFEACLWLNTVELGLGTGNCVQRLGKASWISEPQRAELNDALSRIPETKTRMRSILQTEDVIQIAHLAQSDDPTKIRDFLCLLTTHPDREIAEFASRALVARYGPGSHCSAPR